MGVRANLAFLRKVYALELSAALEYRFNFIMQSLGMLINDTFWIFFWFILFSRFGTIGEWTFDKMIILHAVLVGSFALSVVLFDNWYRLAKLIEDGRMDYYLTLPKNVLLHALAKTSYPGFGDLAYALILAVYAIPLAKWPLYLLLLVTSTMVFLGWGIFTGSLAFYIPNFQTPARQAREAFVSIAFYPSAYSGVTKFLVLMVIPAGFVGVMPVELLTDFSLKQLLIVVAFAVLFLAFAVWFFYRGLKRYESGNVMAMRG